MLKERGRRYRGENAEYTTESGEDTILRGRAHTASQTLHQRVPSVNSTVAINWILRYVIPVFRRYGFPDSLR